TLPGKAKEQHIVTVLFLLFQFESWRLVGLVDISQQMVDIRSELIDIAQRMVDISQKLVDISKKLPSQKQRELLT
ncbi:hypothetical protein, partial [Mesobacillus zeae]